MMLRYRSRIKTQVAAFLLAAFAVSAPSAHAAEFSGHSIGRLETITAKYEDTLVDLALEHQVGYAQLLAANPGVDPWVPGAGRKIIIPNWHLLPDVKPYGIVLNTGELRVYYFPPGGGAPKTFPIGIGREGLNTPQGSTTIVSKTKGPSWRPTPRMRLEDPELPAVVGPGPDNPLGAYALYFGWPSYRMHGTNHEKAIGRRASSGCVRLYAKDIEWLYNNIPVGTHVTSVNQPVKMAWLDGELFLEAQPNDLQIDELEYQSRQITIDIPDGILAKIRQKAGDQVAHVNWETVRDVLVQRTGIPTQITGTPKDVPMNDKTAMTEKSEKPAVEKMPVEKVIAEKLPAVQHKKQAGHDWDSLNTR